MDYQKALNALYDTILEPQSWQSAAIECAKLVHGSTLFVQVVDLHTGAVNVIAGHGLEGLGLEAYEAYYHKVDIWAHSLLRSTRGRIHLYHEIVEQSDYEGSEVFADWVKPGAGYEIYWGLGGALPLWDERHVAFLASHRSRAQGEMTAAERANFEMLVPHLQRVLNLRRLVDAKSAHNAGLEAMCEMSATAALLVDETGRLMYGNRAAIALLGSGEGLRLRRDGIVETQIPAEDHRLRRQIAQVCAGPAALAEGPLKIGRANGKQPLIVTVGPVPRGGESTANCAILFVEDIWARRPADAGKIALALGITTAEARVVAMLSEGHSLIDAARGLGISYHTARAHLRSVLSKTGIRRQSELMLRIARLA